MISVTEVSRLKKPYEHDFLETNHARDLPAQRHWASSYLVRLIFIQDSLTRLPPQHTTLTTPDDLLWLRVAKDSNRPPPVRPKEVDVVTLRQGLA
jgi:hypothetical protein